MIELHRKLLGDSARNAAFVEALMRLVVPGETTMTDLGSGTGFLSFAALKLGARLCTLYESDDIYFLSKKIAQENKITRCSFMPCHSLEAIDPVRTDIVVSEVLGNYPYEEHIIETLNDARRFLKPDGTILPTSLTCSIAPIIAQRLWRKINVWDDIGYDLDFTAAKESALQNMYVKTVHPKEIYGGKKGIRIWDTIDFRRKNSSRRSGGGEWTIDTPVTVFGLALFWDADIITGIHLSTSPFALPTHWEQIYLPVLVPIMCKRGDVLSVEIDSDTRLEPYGVRVQWRIELRRRGRVIAQQHLDSLEGGRY